MSRFPNIGRLLRIHIWIHYTWILALFLIPAAVITQFSTDYPLWQRTLIGIVASLLYFLAIILRELIIGFIAVRKGVGVERVTLFLFGGLPQIDSNTTSPSVEILLAACGELFNIIIAGIFSLIYLILRHSGNVMINVLMQWLAFLCFMLVLFNIIPGFPLDGGRILRAFLWMLTGSYDRATRIAGWVSFGIGLIVAVLAITLLVNTEEWFTGVFLLTIGAVLQIAATKGRRQVRGSSDTDELVQEQLIIEKHE